MNEIKKENIRKQRSNKKKHDNKNTKKDIFQQSHSNRFFKLWLYVIKQTRDQSGPKCLRFFITQEERQLKKKIVAQEIEKLNFLKNNEINKI